jgi:hypothetical protein
MVISSGGELSPLVMWYPTARLVQGKHETKQLTSKQRSAAQLNRNVGVFI